MLSRRLGHILDRPLGGLARKIDVPPNAITLCGFLISAMAGVVLAGNLRLGGVLVVVGAFFDAFDGVTARVNKRATDFGAFLDSVLDRYADAFILSGIAVYLLGRQNISGFLLSLASLFGAFLTSYARARAEGLGIDCKEGLIERPERIILIAAGTIAGFLMPALWALAVLGNITVLQRMFHVWKICRGKSPVHRGGC